MGKRKGEVYGRGAFQLYGSERQVRMSDLLCDVFGRDDITCYAGDWRGILYFTLDEEPDVAPDQVFGFDPSTGDSGELATLPELMASIDRGDITDAVDGEAFSAWLAETGHREIPMGTCAPTVEPEFIGGSADERVTEPRDVVTHVALAAVIMGRLEALDVQPGDPIPDELFDQARWE